jgi:hypothetical protein
VLSKLPDGVQLPAPHLKAKWNQPFRLVSAEGRHKTGCALIA